MEYIQREATCASSSRVGVFLGKLWLVEVRVFERDSKNLFASGHCTRDKRIGLYEPQGRWGDLSFQAKCLDRIAALRETGATIVLVSHDLAAIYRLCDRALLLDRGWVVIDGSPREVVDVYQKMNFSSSERADERDSYPKPAECLGIQFSANGSSHAVRTGYPMVARFSYRATEPIPNAVVRVSMYWPSGYLCAQLTNESSVVLTLEPGDGEIVFQCPVPPIQPGLYRVDLAIDSLGCEVDLRQRCATLLVEAGKAAWGDFYIENTCSQQVRSTRMDSRSHSACVLPNAYLG